MTPTFPLSIPTDGVRWACLGVGLLCLWRGARELSCETPPRWLKWLAPLAAAALSAGYVVYYLRGGPRIIDATAYYLQARTFAAGMLTIPLSDPEQAVMGRFLVRASTEASSAAVLFPPGYPALLAIGFSVGVPLAVGPLLAAGLVLATMDLAERVAKIIGCRRPGTVVVYAAAASVFCGALRYHTADTMSHGLAALCVTVAISAWLRLVTAGDRARLPAATLGFAGGLLFATRPASALALATTLAIALVSRPPKRLATRGLWVAVGASLPVALWLVYQHRVTGSIFSTAQSLYYTTSDGPPGCFRYGFGEGIGCHGEHGTFVDANLAHGYDFVAAAKTTGRRLMMHVSDAMGIAPAFTAVVGGGVVAWRHPVARLLAVVVVAQWLAYAPFYFDGNYPGGGARMFADVLPVEHVLAAMSLSAWRFRGHTVSAPKAGAWLLAGSLLGFALHLGAHHEQLRDREGGQPMFVPERLAGADPTALVFVDTDHGFNLAYDPSHPARIARRHHDAIDALVWQRAGRPPALAYHYRFDTGTAELLPVPAETLTQTRKIEGESLWPAALQHDSWAFPRHVPAPCASRGRVLLIRPLRSSGEVRVALPEVTSGHALAVTLLPGDGTTLIELATYSDGRRLATIATVVPNAPICMRMGPILAPSDATHIELGLRADGPIGLDTVETMENR